MPQLGFEYELTRSKRRTLSVKISRDAAPHNGTTAYLVRDEIIKDVNATAEERAVVAMLTVATAPHLDRVFLTAQSMIWI